MTTHDVGYDPISDEEMADLLSRTVRRGTRLRRRRQALRASLAVVAIGVVALPLSRSLDRRPPPPAGTGTAITTVAAGPFQNVAWQHVEYPGVNFSKVSYPGNLGCNPGSAYGFTPEVQQVTYIRPAAGGISIALVLVRCNNGSDGPSSLYAFTVHAGSTQPHLLQTLLAAPEPESNLIWYATSFSIAHDAVELPLRGVTGAAALCCPNVTETMRWTLVGDHFVGHREPVRRIAPTCVSTRLRVQPGRFETVDGRVEGTIGLTNTSASPCTLSGSPLVQMLGPTGQPLATEVSVTDPTGPVTVITLAPSAPASFALGFRVASGTAATCPMSASLLIIYNGQRENTVTLPLRIRPAGGAGAAGECGQISVSAIRPGVGR
jgi:Protein of unknown function (DUF4232)